MGSSESYLQLIPPISCLSHRTSANYFFQVLLNHNVSLLPAKRRRRGSGIKKQSSQQRFQTFGGRKDCCDVTPLSIALSIVSDLYRFRPHKPTKEIRVASVGAFKVIRNSTHERHTDRFWILLNWIRVSVRLSGKLNEADLLYSAHKHVLYLPRWHSFVGRYQFHFSGFVRTHRSLTSKRYQRFFKGLSQPRCPVHAKHEDSRGFNEGAEKTMKTCLRPKSGVHFLRLVILVRISLISRNAVRTRFPQT